MATWGAHIRIAEAILEIFKDLDEVSFLVGNVGPDCGMPNEDWSQFSPPKAVSHWMDEAKNIQAEAFYQQYLDKEIDDRALKSFLVGYYVHLLTDIGWSHMLKAKMVSDESYQRLKTEPKFIWTIKEDWYDLDHLFFRRNPNGIFHRVFRHITTFPDYLDYYPAGGIERQIRYISGFYSGYDGNPERTYQYLHESEMDHFVSSQTSEIVEILKGGRHELVEVTS